MRMGDVYANHPAATTTAAVTDHHPSSSATVTNATANANANAANAARPIVQMAQLGQAGIASVAGRAVQDYANRYHHYTADPYERDGNGRNNINRFSLNAQQVSEVSILILWCDWMNTA